MGFKIEDLFDMSFESISIQWKEYNKPKDW